MTYNKTSCHIVSRYSVLRTRSKTIRFPKAADTSTGGLLFMLYED